MIVLCCRNTDYVYVEPPIYEDVQLETPGQTKTPVSPPTNPVYSEITDVSAVDPVYNDIDRREPHPRPYEVPLPMQSQHVTMRSAGSVGGVNDKDGVVNDLTRNEAYGLIQNLICQGDVYCYL